MTDTTTWDYRFFDLARTVASWSKDPSTQVGAVIVNGYRQVIGLGYNGFPRGVEDSNERLAIRPTKHLFTAHAERNALDNAHVDVRGSTMYATLCPCNECAKSIIQRGILRVVTAPFRDAEQAELFNFNITKTMFREAGVEFEYLKHYQPLSK